MNIAKELHFDLLLAKVRAKTQPEIFKTLAREAAPLCDSDMLTLFGVFEQNVTERTFHMDEGVAIFDVTSPYIQKPVMAMMTFDQDVYYESLDGMPINIMAVVLSPETSAPYHLQSLASVSRLLHSENLCEALRDVKDADSMQMLFMPTQDWMIAA